MNTERDWDGKFTTKIDPKSKKTTVISIRVTEEEAKNYRAKAHAIGISPSELGRLLITSAAKIKCIQRRRKCRN